MEKRLFVSIPLSKEYREVLAAAQEKDQHRELRYTTAEQFHLTVCFLGDTEEQLLPLIADALSEVVAATDAFSLSFDRIDLFPLKIRQPSMVWAFFKESERFEDLARDVKNALVKADPVFLPLREEWRKDIPHVTLARFRGRNYPSHPRQPLSPLPPLVVDRIELMDSVLYPAGPMYTKLAEFPFKR
jgi:2'-5' RNA ligase